MWDTANETKAGLAMAEVPTPGELVDRLHRLRNSQAEWRKAGDQIAKEIEQAEAAIQQAIAFLKDGVDSPNVNGSTAVSRY